MHGIVQQTGPAGAALPSASSSHSRVPTCRSDKCRPWNLKGRLQPRCQPLIRLSEGHALPSDNLAPAAEQLAQPASVPSAASASPRRLQAKPTSSPQSRGHARHRAKHAWTSSDDLDCLADDPPASNDGDVSGVEFRTSRTHGVLSSAHVPPGPLLSPATARALAKAFHVGDLELASAAPLQAWCGPRRPPAAFPAYNEAATASESSTYALGSSSPQLQRPLPLPHPTTGPLQSQPPATASLPAQRPAGARYRAGVPVDAAAAVAATGGGGAAAGGGSSVSVRGSAGREGSRIGDGDADGDVDVVLLGPTGRPRDLSVLVAAVERLTRRPAGRGCIGCVVVSPSRERVEALQEAAFALLTERGGGPEAMHVMAVHGGTRFREDVSGLRSQTPDLLLATPGRLTELLTTDKVRLSHLFEFVRVLVLDGGEVLSSPAFRPQMERLLRLLPNSARYAPPRTGPPPRHRSPMPPSASSSDPPSLTACATVATPRAVTLLAAAAAPPLSPVAEVGSSGPEPTLGFPPPVSVTGTGTHGASYHPAPPERLHALSHSGGTTPRLPPPAAPPGGGAPLRQHHADNLLALKPSAQRPPHSPPLVPELGSKDGDSAGCMELPQELMVLAQRSLRTGFMVLQIRGSSSCSGSAYLNVGSSAHGAGGQGDGADGGAGVRSLAAAVAEALGGGRDPSPPPQATAAAPPPLVPLHVFPVPYEEHLPYLYVILRQHMLSEGRHKVVVQFPSAHLANLYARLFQALGFPAASSHSRTGQLARQEAVRDFAAAHRGLLFCTEMAGLDAECGLTLVLWVGLPRLPAQLVQHMATLQQVVTAAAVGIRSGAEVGGPAADLTPAVTHQRKARVGGDALDPSAAATAAPLAAAAADGSPRATSAPLSLPLPRCLLMLNDVDDVRPVAMAVAAAMAAAGLGRVLPVQHGAWSGPLDAVAHRISLALPKVSPALKLKGLEGLLGHIWSSRTAAAAAATATSPVRSAAAGRGGASSWTSMGAGLGPQPEQRLGIWARRFATATGLPQPPLLSRHAAARMGLRSVPGITLVDFHAGRPPPPSLLPPSVADLPLDDPWVAIAASRRLQLLRLKEERQRRHQRLLAEHQRRKRQRQAQQRLREQELEERRAEREARPRPHPPEVIGRFRWLRARRRALKAEREARRQRQGQEQRQGQGQGQ